MRLNIKKDFPYVIRLYRHRKCLPTDFVGSGLLLGMRRVLTCAHVADKRQSDETWYAKDCHNGTFEVARFHFCPEAVRERDPEGLVDLAVLELKQNDGDERDSDGNAIAATVLYGLTDFRREIDARQLRAVGGRYLKATETGEIQSATSDTDGTGTPYDIQVAGGIWDGYSGGPVILLIRKQWVCVGIASEGGRGKATSRIIPGDVVCEYLKNHRPECLSATGVQFLDIHAELHTESITETQRVLIKAAIDLLATSKKALEAISKRVSVTSLQNEADWSDAVVRKLLSLSSTPLMLNELVIVMGYLDKQNAKDSADLIEKLAYFLIPASLHETHVRQLTLIITSGTESFEFQAKTKTFVEIAMARINRRPINLRGIQKASDMPSGRLCLVDPPEQGMDENHEGFIQAFVDELSKNVPPEFLSTSRNASVARSENIAAINVELETLHAVQGWQRYYVFKYPENDLERNRRNEVARKLDQLFPRIAFIGLDREHSPTDEQETLSRMRLILCRAANIENPLYGQN